jgi:hypothetical protein
MESHVVADPSIMFLAHLDSDWCMVPPLSADRRIDPALLLTTGVLAGVDHTHAATAGVQSSHSLSHCRSVLARYGSASKLQI